MKSKKTVLWTLSSLLALANVGSPARADDLYAGILAGGNTPSSSNTSTATTIGATLGAKVVPHFGIAFFGSRYGQTSSGSLAGLRAGTSLSTTILAAQANFFVGGLHLGGDLGSEITSWSGNAAGYYTEDSTSELVYGPEAGYDFRLGLVSLGAEVHYLISTAAGEANSLQALAALKVWL